MCVTVNNMLIYASLRRHVTGIELIRHLVEVAYPSKVLHAFIRIIIVHCSLHCVRRIVGHKGDLAVFINVYSCCHAEEHVKEKVMYHVIVVFPVLELQFLCKLKYRVMRVRDNKPA